MPIGEFCNREVVIGETSTTVLEAARLMRQHHVGCLVVVDSLAASRRPLGVVTDRDLVVEVLAKEVAADRLTIGDLITAQAATVPESAGIFDTLRFMRAHGYRRMPVVDAGGDIVGIVTLDDFLALVAEEMTEISHLIVAELRQEAQLRH